MGLVDQLHSCYPDLPAVVVFAFILFGFSFGVVEICIQGGLFRSVGCAARFGSPAPRDCDDGLPGWATFSSADNFLAFIIFLLCCRLAPLPGSRNEGCA